MIENKRSDHTQKKCSKRQSPHTFNVTLISGSISDKDLYWHPQSLPWSKSQKWVLSTPLTKQHLWKGVTHNPCILVLESRQLTLQNRQPSCVFNCRWFDSHYRERISGYRNRLYQNSFRIENNYANGSIFNPCPQQHHTNFV